MTWFKSNEKFRKNHKNQKMCHSSLSKSNDDKNNFETSCDFKRPKHNGFIHNS